MSDVAGTADWAQMTRERREGRLARAEKRIEELEALVDACELELQGLTAASRPTASRRADGGFDA